MTKVAHGDFETRSTVDLKATGLYTYARHPETDALCFSWCIDEGPVSVWTPGEPFPVALSQHIETDGVFVGHNVGFEFDIWNEICGPRYGWPSLRLAQCECTAAMAYSMGMPGALEDAAPAAGIDMRKDAAGKRLMLQMCKPRSVAPLTWWEEPEKIERLKEYCKQDTEVERALHKRLVQLSKRERDIWLLDHKINARGIHVDRNAITSAQVVVAQEQDRLNAELRKLTDNFVGFATETQRLKDWIAYRGIALPGIAKADVLEALDDADLPADVRRVLEIRKESGRSSTAKLGSMLSAAGADDRVRGILQYHGAATGRWAGRRIQPQNFPRPKFPLAKDDADELRLFMLACEHIGDGDYLANFIGNPVDVVVSCLRGLITAPPGFDLMAGDWANIEGRLLAWAAGEEWKLNAFRAFDAGTGPDIYKLTYSKSFGVPIGSVTKADRQIGKVEELALGYQGGVGAFQQMAKGYGVKVTDERANEIKVAWRAAHPRIVSYWHAVEAAAITAVQTGAVAAVGPKGREVKFRKSGSFLWCRLPSGRVLCYPYPKIHMRQTPWGTEKETLTYFTVMSQGANGDIVPDPAAFGKWQRVSTYGGSLVENIVQGVARDVLADAMIRLDSYSWRIVMHVHDEVVVEIPEAEKELALSELSRILSEVPTWAEALPLAVECWRGKRYRK